MNKMSLKVDPAAKEEAYDIPRNWKISTNLAVSKEAGAQRINFMGNTR